jgi:predicted MFS family arabinose efflux permease
MMGGSLAISGIGWLPGFAHVAGAVALGGIFSGLCHPDMAKRAGTVSQVRQGFAVSLYVTGGRLGFALGPYIAIAVATFLGMEWLWIYVFPSIAMALVIFLRLPESGRAAGREAPAPAPPERKGLLASIRPVRGALAILVGFSVCRTVVTTNLLGFLPTFYVERGMGLWGGATANAVMLASGSIGVIMGGVLADRYGKRRVILWGTAWGLIALTAFLAAPSALGLAVLAIFGAGIYLPMGVSIALAQDLLPSHRGFASSLPLGTTIFIASLSVLPFSWAAGRAGLLAAFWALPVFLAGSLFFALALPKDR